MFHTYEIFKMLHEPVTLPIHRLTFRNCNEHELTHISFLSGLSTSMDTFKML